MAVSVGVLWAQGDKAEIRQGNREFLRGKFDGAKGAYYKALGKDSTSVPARYNLSNTWYRENEYEQAETELKERVMTFSDPLQRAKAFHNLGNIQLMQKKYAESIESYKNALRLRPNDMETKENLAYAQKMKEEEEEEEGDGESDQDNQDQDDQDQNQDQNQDQKQDQREQETPPKISPQDAQQILEAMLQKERETQEKVKEKEKAVVVPPSKKNW